MSEGDGSGSRLWTWIFRIGALLALIVSVLTLPKIISEFREGPPPTTPISPSAQAPVEDAFIVSPVSWGRDLTVTVRKARTGYKGNIVVFWCNPANGHYGWIGEAAFGSASDDYVMGSEYDTDNILIGINVNPEDGDPKTVISAWDLKKPRQTKPPQARPGTLQCIDFAGEH